MLDKEKYQAELEGGQHYFDIVGWCAAHEVDIDELPFSIRLLLENNLRHYDGKYFTDEYLRRLSGWSKGYEAKEVPFLPGRILLQDLTGVPAAVDLAAMREKAAAMGLDPAAIYPRIPVDLVIDHSVSMDYTGTPEALAQNVELEFERNAERYRFLKWAENALPNFKVHAPGQGICHQVNLEQIAGVVLADDGLCYPDTVVGTDSHTTMINGLGVLGWGVGGIEAEAAMLGQPIYLLNPEVVGVELTGRLSDDVTATDLVLYLTHLLRKVKVVGKFVEYFGEGAESLGVTDRATVANMSPEYGATMGYFPVDEKTLDYLRLTGRTSGQIRLVENYCRKNKLFRGKGSRQPKYTQVVTVDLSAVRPALAGPKRPQDLVLLAETKASFAAGYPLRTEPRQADAATEKSGTFTLANGDIVLAAITSCTNTSNPQVILGAGLLAKKAVAAGLRVPGYVKTSFAPGSLAVTRYLQKAGLLPYLEKLGFAVAGYGCATCIGNSGPLSEEVSRQIKAGDLQVVGILSGNRNFEGRIHSLIPANYLASPLLVVAFALAGRIDIDLTTEPLGFTAEKKAVYFKDICPSREEIEEAVKAAVLPEFFRENASAFTEKWQALSGKNTPLYPWEPDSTYVRLPDFFDRLPQTGQALCFLEKAKVLGVLGDSITTDHISPAGSIALDSPAARYLTEHGTAPADFNSYGSRRGNHEVMMRGTFANIRLRNQMAGGKIGGYTMKDGRLLSIYDAAMEYQKEGTPLIMLAGKEYGTGSSRDWAAKGPLLLGVKAVIAESFERIHRSNLLGMGILPLEFLEGESAAGLGLSGTEEYTICLTGGWQPNVLLQVEAAGEGNRKSFAVRSRLDNEIEIEYFLNGGILNTVLLGLS
ncbi:aconitate hydratase AcnA [Lachnospiraceae bacterium oral taxon 500]|nr:aconitate hydratase AcnA [Lachnospiraceae bacterium oral taxon 500]